MERFCTSMEPPGLSLRSAVLGGTFIPTVLDPAGYPIIEELLTHGVMPCSAPALHCVSFGFALDSVESRRSKRFALKLLEKAVSTPPGIVFSGW